METCRTVASIFKCAIGRSSALALALAWGAAAAQAPDPSCSAGSLHLALRPLQAALDAAATPADKARAAARLGEVRLRMNQLGPAQALLEQAVAEPALPARERAAALLDLGNLQLARKRPADAEAAWARAAEQVPSDAELVLASALNRARLLPAEQRLDRLQPLEARAAALGTPLLRARHLLNLATQARELPGGTALAARATEAGRQQALAAADDRLAAQAYEGLAALHEGQQRHAEALTFTEQAIAHASRTQARDLLMNLESRAGRLARRLGQDDTALAAYRRAVDHIEAVRADIPVLYQDGRSSFRQTLEPTYLALTDLLLQRSTKVEGPARQAVLRQARDTVELIKQTELEDYLRDRCSVGSARSAAALKPPPGTAIWYPIILPDRLELLLETERGIERRSADIAGETLREQVLDFVAALRAGNPMRARSEALYRWLVKPLEPLLAEGQVHTLVAVPDGVLRLLPLGALNDGRQWLLEKMAVATVPGLTLTAAPQRDRGRLQVLLAGMSEPGPVVDKLSDPVVEGLLEPGTDARALRSAGPQRSSALREALALPGVKQEIDAIAQTLPGTVLLDQRFTLAALQEQLRSRSHALVHIASHGVFGDSADSTFIMTYDELLTLDNLQNLLKGERRGTPIELLTLSACQTAEGDDRAPLGMSGAALKARARSALGTLWPVSDDAANRVMSGFYRRLAAGAPRVQALREAQLELLALPNRRHPFYWAPFILIGDWQ
ncbi:MAG: CHAT domain-containing protein [Rubrivivax sp.]|nr:CHAT domain-containing protein [Rubrivivax sp.]